MGVESAAVPRMAPIPTEQTTTVSILDRLLHLVTDGDSYRMREAQR